VERQAPLSRTCLIILMASPSHLYPSPQHWRCWPWALRQCRYACAVKNNSGLILVARFGEIKVRKWTRTFVSHLSILMPVMEPPAKAQSSSRIPELDGVRGVAILLVVICHYFGGDTHGPPNFPFSLVKDVVSLFWCGVDLFFVLSGFLIGGILMDQRNSAGYFKTFYVRRVCRILPLYFAWIALFFLVIAVLGAVVRFVWYSVEFLQLPHFFC